MKIKCDKCKSDIGPCVIDIDLGESEWPGHCLWGGDAEWEEVKENTCVMGPNAKSCETCARASYDNKDCAGCIGYSKWEPKKESDLFDMHGVCEYCRNNDETCSLCDGCFGQFFEPKTAQKKSEKGYIDHAYTPESTVSRHEAKILELVKAHWSYMEKVLTTGADEGRLFTFDEVMKIREWDYISSAIHFYGHGFDDGFDDGLNKKKEG